MKVDDNIKRERNNTCRVMTYTIHTQNLEKKKCDRNRKQNSWGCH